jgi:hypothetical protein
VGVVVTHLMLLLRGGRNAYSPLLLLPVPPPHSITHTHVHRLLYNIPSSHKNHVPHTTSQAQHTQLTLKTPVPVLTVLTQRKAVDQGLECLSMRGYILKYLQAYPELLDLVANDTAAVGANR